MQSSLTSKLSPENDEIPYLFACKPIPAISRDPKLVTQNTDPMLTKKNSGNSRL